MSTNKKGCLRNIQVQVVSNNNSKPIESEEKHVAFIDNQNEKNPTAVQRTSLFLPYSSSVAKYNPDYVSEEPISRSFGVERQAFKSFKLNEAIVKPINNKLSDISLHNYNKF